MAIGMKKSKAKGYGPGTNTGGARPKFWRDPYAEGTGDPKLQEGTKAYNKQLGEFEAHQRLYNKIMKAKKRKGYNQNDKG